MAELSHWQCVAGMKTRWPRQARATVRRRRVGGGKKGARCARKKGAWEQSA